MNAKQQILTLCRELTARERWELGIMLLNASNEAIEKEIKVIWQIATPEQKLRLKTQKNEVKLRLK